MPEEKKEDKEEEIEDISQKVEEFTLREIEKAKSRKSLFETFDVDPLGYIISEEIKETFSQQYIANDERQAKVIFKINRVTERLHRYLVNLQMLLESGRITDDATKEMAKELIIYYGSLISSLLMSYKSIASGIYNTSKQNYPAILPTNGIPPQKQQQ
jgi:glycerophosphoryl diester phosphodiesterase